MYDLAMKKISQVKKAVIPAAGLGTRFFPATKTIPKEMLPVVDKPIILYVIEEAIQAGIEDIVLIQGRGIRACCAVCKARCRRRAICRIAWR
jgi:UTP-glucose-1-phosphate uridylyltransferase